jgi:hypothetical protein
MCVFQSVLQVCCYFEGHMVLTFSDSGELTGWSGEPILLDNSVPKVRFLSLRGFFMHLIVVFAFF